MDLYTTFWPARTSLEGEMEHAFTGPFLKGKILSVGILPEYSRGTLRHPHRVFPPPFPLHRQNTSSVSGSIDFSTHKSSSQAPSARHSRREPRVVRCPKLHSPYNIVPLKPCLVQKSTHFASGKITVRPFARSPEIGATRSSLQS